MFGFLIGTACLIGLMKVLRRGSCGGRWGHHAMGGYGYGGGGCGSRFQGGPWGHHGGHGGYGYGDGGRDEGREDGSGFGPTHGGPFRTHGREGWRRGGPFFANMMLRRLFEMLDTTPGQEKVIAAAMEELRSEAAKHRAEVKKTREDIAKVMRGASVDETMMGELFARHDSALESMRKALVGAMAKVHEALEPEQRSRLADMIERTPGFWGSFGGRGVAV